MQNLDQNTQSMHSSVMDSISKVNPFSDSTRVQEMKQSQDMLRRERQNYYNQSIVQKTQKQQKPKLINAELKRETDQLYKSAQDNPILPNDQLPESFTARRREGVKAYIERQRQISRVLYNTSMKQVEIQHLHDDLDQQNQNLTKKELMINQQLRQLELQMMDLEKKAIEDQNLNKLNQQKMELVRRKVDELSGAIEAVYQEIDRQNTMLRHCRDCRDIIEQVALHCVQAGAAREFQGARQAFLENLDVHPLQYDDSSILRQSDLDQSNLSTQTGEGAGTKQKRVFGQKSRKSPAAMSNTTPQNPLLGSGSLTAPSVGYFSHPAVQELAENVCEFAGGSQMGKSQLIIDFDFDKFLAGLNMSLDQVFRNRALKNLAQTAPASSSDANSPLKYDGIFERLQAGPGVVQRGVVKDAVALLRETCAENQKLPFINADEFISSIGLLETSNLVKTQHLQDQEAQLERETDQARKSEAECERAETLLRQQKAELEQKITNLTRQVNNIFNRESYEGAVESFIYDLDMFGSQDELMFQKYSDELAILQQSIATAGAFCGAIGSDVDDLNMQSNIILGKMELLLNGTIEKLKQYKQNEFQNARRELTKMRREMTRASKFKEMSEQKEKDRLKQEARDERAKRIVPVQKQVFARSFVQEQKKTQKQIELETKLRQKQFEDQNHQANFYDD